MRPVRPWAMHYQHVWKEHSDNLTLPLWLRVVCLAYGTHKANGHANYGPGEMALALVMLDRQTGELTAPRSDNVTRGIRIAIDHGFLTRESYIRCLVVPPHAIEMNLGNPHAPCHLHKTTQILRGSDTKTPQILRADHSNLESSQRSDLHVSDCALESIQSPSEPLRLLRKKNPPKKLIRKVVK